MVLNIVNLTRKISLLRENLINHLEVLIETLDTTEFYLNEISPIENRYLKISDIAVEPIVITEELLRVPPKFLNENTEEKAKLPEGDILADILAENYESPFESEKYRKRSWSQVLENNKFIVVKGQPGGGKTFITKYTAIKIAERSLHTLRSFSQRLEDIEIPIWITANRLAEYYAKNSEVALDQLICQLIKFEDGEKLHSVEFYEWLRLQLNRPGQDLKTRRFTIFIDALDEIEGKNEIFFQQVAKKITALLGNIIITCRKMRWETQQRIINWNKITTVELDHFNNFQKEEVINRFFSSKLELRNSFKRITDQNYSLKNSLASPLMLTFACLLHRTGNLDEETGYLELYSKIVENLFTGEYVPFDRKPYWTKQATMEFPDYYTEQNRAVIMSPETKREMLMNLFDGISWQLFHQKPESKEFNLLEWNKAYAASVEIIKNDYPQIEKIADQYEFQHELLRIRLLVFTRKTKGNQSASYLHKSFLEFLSARALSKKNDWLGVAKMHFRDKYWLETLTFLAGLVSNVKSLMGALRQEPSDIFGWKIFLGSRFTGISNLAGIDIQPICDSVIGRLAALYINSKENYFDDYQKLAPALIYSPLLKQSYSNLRLSKSCKKYLFDNMTAHLINQLPADDYELADMFYALSNINDDDNRVIDFLISLTTLINREDLNDRQTIIGKVCTVLAKLGRVNAKITNFLISELPSAHNYRSTSLEVIDALRDLSIVDERAEDSLISIIEDSAIDDYIRGQVIEALKNLGQANDNVIDSLLRLAENQFVHDYLRTKSIDVLKTLKRIDQKIIDRLILIAADSSHSYGLQTHIIGALGELGKMDAGAVNFLMSIVDNPLQSDKLIENVVEALGKISNPNERVIEFLYTAAQNENNTLETRYKAMISMLNLGVIDDEIMHILISAVQNQNNSVANYTAAVKVLGSMDAFSNKFNDWIFSFIDYLLTIDEWSLKWEIISTLGKIGENDDRFRDILFSFLENVELFCHKIDEFYEDEDEDEDEPIASRVQLDYYMIAALFGEAALSVEKIFSKKTPTNIQLDQFLRLMGNCLNFFSEKDLYADQKGSSMNAELHKSDDLLGVLFRISQKH